MLATILAVIHHLGGVILNVLPINAALALAFTVIGLFATPCNPGMRWWRKPDLVTDGLFMFVLPLMTGYVRIAFLIVGAVFIYRVEGGPALTRFFENGHGPLSNLPFWIQVVAYLLLSDLMMYGTHRAFHTMSLWRFHAVHHAPQHLDWSSATRFHPVNIFFHSVLADAVLLLLGVAPQTLAYLAPFNVATSALVHANLDWTFGPFRYWFASPVFHRWHHTDYRRGGNMNFAPTFPIIDLMFGTFYMPKGELPDRYGVHDKHFPEDFVRQLLYPFRRKRAPAAGRATQPAA